MNPGSLKVSDTVDSKKIMNLNVDPFQDLFSTFFLVEYSNYMGFAMFRGFSLGGLSVVGRKLKYTNLSLILSQSGNARL